MEKQIQKKNKKNDKIRKCFLIKKCNIEKLKKISKNDNRSMSSFLDNFIEHYEGEKNGRKNENN